MHATRVQRWRSVHFVPGASDRMLARATDLAADALILDLEDAVPPEGKHAARARVTDWLARTTTQSDRLVRINPLDTEWGVDDLRTCFEARPDGFVLPKVEGRADLEAVDTILAELEALHAVERGTTAVIPIATETPRALLRIEEIADSARVVALTWGAEDLSSALGAVRTRDDEGRYLEVFRLARHFALLAAHAAGVAAIDGVYTDFRDTDGLVREAREAAETGFTGKLTIHPAQIEPINAAFTPDEERVRAARELLAAWETHRAAGKGAFAFEGEMVDAPHLARARALLERAGG